MKYQNSSWKFGLILGFFAFAIVFSINWKINLIETALIRASLSFVLFSTLGILSLEIFNIFGSQKKSVIHPQPENNVKQMDNQLFNQKEQNQEDELLFQPIQFEKIVDHQEVVKGVRNWMNSDV